MPRDSSPIMKTWAITRLPKWARFVLWSLMSPKCHGLLTLICGGRPAAAAVAVIRPPNGLRMRIGCVLGIWASDFEQRMICSRMFWAIELNVALCVSLLKYWSCKIRILSFYALFYMGERERERDREVQMVPKHSICRVTFLKLMLTCRVCNLMSMDRCLKPDSRFAMRNGIRASGRWEAYIYWVEMKLIYPLIHEAPN